ncbi:esterase family protein [Herbiconiux sp. L3-i23]|uniref:alpha/beta hydrolase n=1 Tax=Herbiconiux sp. L3-i23 TaxID=2905871 RepID=UPI00205EBDA4|nr:alpha/beta hydrolase-fold protein [Herbiconiux sp. L3-i23]BDI23063.1 esterase [Herbiconiux sp. L3-i23]
MADFVSTVSIVDGPLFIASFVLAGALALALLVPRYGIRLPAKRFFLIVAGAGLVGAVIGAVVNLLLSDVLNIFGVSLTWVVRIADTIAFAAFGIALATLVFARWWRAVLGAVLAALTAWCLFLTINVDFGQYPTVGDALGTSYGEAFVPPERAGGSLADWTAPADLPDTGMVGVVDIPAVEAAFAPRPAAVYLPPAALVAGPPRLPVIVALSGQPGTPTDVFSAGGMDALMDSIAARHDGVAPIVVVPDQLGDPSRNPMCVDGAAGDSATYLTVDVADWIRSTLPVATDRTSWTIAGFSQGGTCAIQLGAAYPEIFGSIIDVSGEEAPSLGSPEKTIDDGFGGDADAYRAETPIALLDAQAPYVDSVAYFVAGEHDLQYSAYMQAVSAAAENAGMSVFRAVSPGTGHDWNTARFGFASAVAALLDRWGIG